MFITSLNRWSAFGIHLAISVAILIALLIVIFFYWFPYDLIFAGGIDGLKILMGVDLVLGPVLTLIVFNPLKKRLKMDLTIIGVTQVGCLLAGLWLIYNERPLTQVLADDGIYLQAASDYAYYDIDLPKLPGKNPKFVMMDLPEDRDAWGSIRLTSELMEEMPFAFREDLYLPISSVSDEVFNTRVQQIQERMDPEDIARSTEHDCVWLPVHSKHVPGTACVSKEDGIVELSNKNIN